MIILVVGVIAMLGMLILAWNVAYKSAADLASRGDQLMAEGDIKQAERSYSKAVNKDATNPIYLDKWIGALEQIVPETETEYTDRFYGDFIGAIRQASTIQRREPAAHERYLQIRHDMLMTRYSRSLADRNIEDATGSLAHFTGSAESEVQPWERLRRYRGLPIAEIARKGGVINSEQIELGLEDLERAIAADPDDVESIIGLMNLRMVHVNRTAPEIDVAARTRVLEENMGIVENFLDEHPGNVEMRIQQMLLSADLQRREIGSQLDDQALVDAMNDLYAGFRPELEEIYNHLLGSANDQLTIEVVKLYSVLERVIHPTNQQGNTQRLLDRMIDSDKENAELYWIAGSVARDANQLEEALGWYARIADLSPKPLSYDGMRQYEYRRRAQLSQAEIKIDQAMALRGSGTQDEVNAALESALEYRNRFASAVSDDNLAKVMLDGKIAHAKRELDEALRLFKRYNDETQRNDPEGLWYEGLVASELGQYGLARTALTEMIPLDSTNRKLMAMLTLAQIHWQLQDYDAAAQLYKDVLVINPGVQPAIDGLEAVNKVLNPELNEDPVIAAIFTARQMRSGDEENPGDFAGALQSLRDAAETHSYDPRIARELASLLLDSNDVDGARAVIARSIESNPDDESLQAMAQAMNSTNTTDILIEMIRQSERSELDKLLTVAQVASDRDRPELLDSTLEELKKIAPDDKRVLELRFVHALRNNDLETARGLAAHGQLSRLEKLGFEARIATTEGNPEKAIDLLEQAAASGRADASVFHMLAVLQRETGRYNEAIQSFERALSIRPDNQQSITEYVVTLATMGQYEQALSVARRMQRYGSNDPAFMNIWLNLESLYGGEQGRDFAINQRERMLEINPTNIDNRYQLARLYITTKQWDAARMLIDQLRAENDRLIFVELDATWYADQGVYDGRNALTVANEVFANYIASLPSPVGAEPYVANAEFMLSRGRPDLAEAAAREAIERQSAETMLGSKLLGDLYMRINNYAGAAEAYREVIDAGADEDHSFRARLIETLVRMQRYDDAQGAYDALPESKKGEMVTRLQAADIAIGRGDREEAGRIMDRAVANYPNEPLVYIKRAELMIGEESLLTDLQSDINRALTLDANSWRAYRVRAAAYFALDRRDDALDDLRSAIRLNPSLDQSVYAVLNEMLSQDGRAGEAMAIAREIVSRRSNDANLISRIAGLFASRDHWDYAAEFYGQVWDTRRGINDGATYIDAMVRTRRPDITAANNVINTLATMVGDINKSAGLLAAQALVLQAAGRDEFAIQQITKAFDLSVKSEAELLGWSGNVSRFFENRPTQEYVQYLEALKRRTNDGNILDWLDLFIARDLLSEDQVPSRAFEIVERLAREARNPELRLRAYRLHGTTLFGQERFEDAADVWRAGLEVFSDDWEMNNNLAYVLSEKMDNPQEAMSFGQRAIDKNIDRSEAYETMASIYIRLGRYDEAQQMIEAGSGYIQSVPGRVTMLITNGRLEMARGNLLEAQTKLTEAQSMLRSSPQAYPSLEQDIEAFEQDINSAEG
ncbi:MAG: tetratricopeptide repeat protein [Phycisphaerales bacterium]